MAVAFCDATQLQKICIKFTWGFIPYCTIFSSSDHISDSKIFLSNQKWYNFLLSPKKSDITYLPAESGANSTYQNMPIFLDLRFMQDRCTDVILYILLIHVGWFINCQSFWVVRTFWPRAIVSYILLMTRVIFHPRKKIEMSKAQTKTCFRIVILKKRDRG